MTLHHVMPWKATDPGAITLLTARGKRLAKLHTPDGEQPYDDAALFYVAAAKVDAIEDVAELLGKLAHAADTCIVRAALKVPISPISEIRCRVHDREGQPALFAEVARRWLMVDLEPDEAPSYVDPTDPILVGGWLRRQLPPPFQAARVVVQLSGGAGIKPGLRAHLWFLLDRPLVKVELDRLLGGVVGLDRSTLRPRQLHYTAAPLFKDVDDPVLDRIAMLPGYPDVQVGAIPEPARPARLAFTPSVFGKGGSGRAEAYAAACLRRLALAPEGSRHSTCVAVSCRLLALAKAGLLDPMRVASQIKAVMLDRGFDGRSGRDLGEVVSILEWAWQQVEPEGLPDDR